MHGVETRFSSLTFISKVNIAVCYILPTFLFLLLLFLLLLLVLPGTTTHTPVPITSLYSYKKLSTHVSTECLQHTYFHWMFITHLGDIGIASGSILQVAKLAEKISKFPKRWKQLAIIWMQVFFFFFYVKLPSSKWYYYNGKNLHSKATSCHAVCILQFF